jgi:benzoyl-CoA reductase/2-hydroxyglutaryl-CoA dehydratase subunit BcrC/BadD/HgdB
VRASAPPVIGVVGADLPRQLVLAAGAVPHRILGSWHGAVSRDASELLGAADAVAGRILDELLAGRHDTIAGLVVCNDSAANLRLFYVLRILAERGRIPFPVHLLDAPRGAGEPRRRFVTGRYARLAAFCGGITGSPVDAAALAAAAARELALGASLRRLRQRRLAGGCTGVAALAAYREAAQRPPEEAIPIVDAAAGRADGAAVRVFVTGSAHPDPSLYAVVEDAGAVIVGEDFDTGDAAWLGDAVPDGETDAVFATLAERHLARPPLAARSTSAERAALLAARVAETGAAAVAALVREHDDAPAWDLPAQRAAVRVPVAARIRIAPDGGGEAAADIAAALARLGREAS